MEMVLASLAACSGSTVVSLLCRMHKDVAGFKASAKGIRGEEPPTVFQRILLEFVLITKDGA